MRKKELEACATGVMRNLKEVTGVKGGSLSCITLPWRKSRFLTVRRKRRLNL